VWCVVCGVWCVVCGVWCVVCGVWCVVCGVHTTHLVCRCMSMCVHVYLHVCSCISMYKLRNYIENYVVISRLIYTNVSVLTNVSPTI